MPIFLKQYPYMYNEINQFSHESTNCMCGQCESNNEFKGYK